MILDLVVRGRNQASGPVDEVTGSVNRLNKSAKETVQQGLTPFSNAVSTMVAGFATQAITGLANSLRNLVGSTIRTGSDIEETASAFNVAFGDAADATRTRLVGLADDMQRSQYEFQGYALRFQNIFVPLGYARKEAAEMSTTLTTLVSDVASFHNAQETDVMANFQSGLVGEHEALRKFGIIITEASLKQELMNMGKSELTGASLEQAKVQARLNMILAATTDAQGDAIRTGGGYANVMRGLQATIMDVRAGIGEKLLPVATAFFKEVRDFINDHAEGFIGFFGRVVETVKVWGEKFDFRTALDALMQFVMDAGNVMLTFVDIFSGVEYRGKNFADLFEYLPDSIEPFFLALARMAYLLRDVATWFWDVLRPVREWIAEHIHLSDVLIAFGIWIGSLLAGPLAALVTGFGGIALAIGGLTLLVALVRNAWENDWGGIQEKADRIWKFLVAMWTTVRNTFQEHGAGALREIVDFVTKGEANFYHLGQILDTLWYVVRTTFGYIRDWIGEMLGAAWNTVKLWGSSLLEWAGTNAPRWAEALGRWGTAAIAWIGDAVARTGEALGRWWATLSAWAGANLPQWAAALGRWAEATWAWITGVAIPGVAGPLGQLWNTFAAWAGNNLPAWAAKLGEWAGVAWRWITETAIPQVRAKLGEWWGIFAGWFVEHAPAWSERLGAMALAAWAWISEVAIPQARIKLDEWWGIFAAWFATNTPMWLSNLGKLAATGWEWLRDTLIPNTVTQLGGWWTQFSAWFASNWPIWTQKLGEWAAAAWTWIRDTAIPNTIEQMGTWWTELRGFLTLKWDEWKYKLALWGGRLWKWIEEAFPETTRKLTEWWTQKIKPKLDEYKPLLDKELRGWKGIIADLFGQGTKDSTEREAVAWWVKLYNKINESGELLELVLVEWSTSMVEWIGKSLPKAITAITNWIIGITDPLSPKRTSDTQKKLDAAYEDLANAMWTAIARIEITLRANALRLGMALAQGIWDGLTGRERDGAINEAGKVVNGTLYAMNVAADAHSPSRKTTDLGRNIVKGLQGGLEDWPAVSSLLAAGRKLASDAIDAIKRAAGVQSPSTETYRIGAFLVEGAALGVQSNANVLSSTMASLGSSMVTSFASTVRGGLSSANDDLMRQLDSILAQIQARTQQAQKSAGSIVQAQINSATANNPAATTGTRGVLDALADGSFKVTGASLAGNSVSVSGAGWGNLAAGTYDTGVAKVTVQHVTGSTWMPSTPNTTAPIQTIPAQLYEWALEMRKTLPAITNRTQQEDKVLTGISDLLEYLRTGLVNMNKHGNTYQVNINSDSPVMRTEVFNAIQLLSAMTG